ncbi:hypothetical protein G7Y89_g3548 [Cudoniella acicularis]|uniref:C2H2-type domain-containing protein n=1 Tax=Cudoniella acicularis TaxID=354080 RepID=A0A8H4W5H5_9HELO|nr:hypothetical protein G7Y89_g3548 [Cudoniella acicularis]
MPPVRLGSRDFLEYDARYGVLICRKCQYAIQKSALQSHLLRHKIYRDERQRLLSSIAQLDLFEPDDVPLPTPTSPPIDALPIISGYRCTAVGCRNLCASSKRMRSHQSEIHGLGESQPSNSSSFVRPVKLQTFFRGTKLSYFEVTPSRAADTATTTTGDDEDKEDERDDEEGPTPPETPQKFSPVNLDLNLQTLAYFHHFTTATSLTLPSTQHPRPATHYWQTDVVLQALRRRWLMCGLLTLSACHLAALADDTVSERVHRERSAQFYSEFSTGWEEIGKRDLGEEGAMKAGGHIKCVLRCAHWALAEFTLDQGITSPSELSKLQSIMTTIRGFVVPVPEPEPDLALWPGGVRSGDDHGKEASALLSRLHTLPFRMAEAFGKPDNVQDVLAVLSAIAALVECYSTSFAETSDEAGAAWQGMATWLTKIPDHFNDMVLLHSPAALVVLAHWAVSLAKRAEDCGCWFLRGSAKMILLLIAERLPADDRKVQSLLPELA